MVLADGCFDPFHVGHARYLFAARQFCLPSEELAIRVAPDAVIRRKGREPYQSQYDRCRMLEQWCVQTYTDDDLARTVALVAPRLLVKGWDWLGHLPADVIDACRRAGTAVAFVPTVEQSASARLHGLHS